MQIEKRILVIEDDARSAGFLSEALQLYGFKVTLANNGQMALELYESNPFPLVITDLELPAMSGKEIISKLKESENPPLIIVQTAHNNTQSIIETMRLGVFDYLIKPIKIKDLIQAVKNAFETYHVTLTEMYLEKEKISRMQDELKWFKWIEENAGKSSAHAKSREQTLFYNLKSSVVQGSGFGSLVSLIDIISKSSKKEGNQFLVNAELMEEVFKSNVAAKNIIKSLVEINKILNDEIKLAPTPVDEIYELIKIKTSDLRKYREIKEQMFVIDKPKFKSSSFKVDMNVDFFKKLIEELLINAMKFSPREAKITILLNAEEQKSLLIQVMNPAVEDSKKRVGISIEYENLIFEPFFRMNQILSNGYDTLDIGIGLTMIKHIIKKLNGEVIISNSKDHREFSNSQFQVNAKVRLPFINLTAVGI